MLLTVRSPVIFWWRSLKPRLIQQLPPSSSTPKALSFAAALDFADPPQDEFFAERLAKPIVAAIQGVALSAGVALLANAHIVVAAQGSSFGLTDIREGRPRYTRERRHVARTRETPRS